jgi:hypothetical protein
MANMDANSRAMMEMFEKTMAENKAELVAQLDVEKQRHTENEKRHEQEMKNLVKSLQPQQGPNQTGGTSSIPAYSSDLTPSKPPALTNAVTLSAFDSWVSEWEKYAIHIGLSEMGQTEQIVTLSKCFDSELKLTVRHRIKITDSSNDNVVQILEKIRQHLRDERNLVLDRVMFHERKQREDESFNSFFVSLKDIAENCSFCVDCKDCKHCDNCRDGHLVTSIVSGVYDQDLRHKLLEHRVIKLDDAVSICQAHEAMATKRAPRQSNNGNQINRQDSKYMLNSPKQSRQQQQQQQCCPKCGGDCADRKCPAVKDPCKNCKKTHLVKSH